MRCSALAEGQAIGGFQRPRGARKRHQGSARVSEST
ncbi:MAG: hypothetical protein RL087_1366, partial [Pseudomonadota bacterium]